MRKLLLLLSSLILLSGCSLQKIALNTTTGLFSYGIEAIYAEPDLEIAETAVASNLKLLEGFHRADPQNETLLQILTQGYSSYSLAFLEQTEPERASALYLRSRDYGFKLLQQTDAFDDGIPSKQKEFERRLSLVKKSEVGALFWTAFAWSGWINLNRDDPQAVFDLSTVKAMMDRVLELDETFFFGAAHLFWGSTYGSLPKMLGGNPDKAREHFQRCIEISEGKFLLAKVYYAQYYAAPTLNEKLFEETLNEVLDAPQDVLPDYELLTSLAKKRAQTLLQNKEEFF